MNRPETDPCQECTSTFCIDGLFCKYCVSHSRARAYYSNLATKRTRAKITLFNRLKNAVLGREA